MKIANVSKSKTRKTTPLKANRVTAPTAPKAAPKAVNKAKPAVKTIALKANRAVTPLPTPAITTELIAQRAYLIWEQQGRPAGREKEHWLLAEQQLKSSQSFAN